MSGTCSVARVQVPLPSDSLVAGFPQALGSDGVRVTMESALTARDRVGVQDFVLLENFTSEAAFIENLRRRFRENLIYVRAMSSAGPTDLGEGGARNLQEKPLTLLFYPTPPDLHWPCPGLCQPLPGPTDLHTATYGTLPWRQFL